MNITKLANMQNVMKTLISRASQHSKKLAASPWNRDLHISVMRLAKEPNEDEITSVSERCINQVMLMGRLGSDPVRKGSESHPVATFSLATNSTYGYSSGEIVQKTDWHRVVIFKPSLRDNVLKYLGKGHRALVQGRLIYGEVKDSEGHTRSTCSVVADDVIFLSPKAS